MDSSMANMGQGQVQQTTSGATMDNMAKGNQPGSDAVLQQTKGVSRHRRTTAKVKIGLTFDELSRIASALKEHFNIKENEKNDWGDLLRKIQKTKTKALQKEMDQLLAF